MSTIRKPYWDFRFFHKIFSKTEKKPPILTILVEYGWLRNLSLLFLPR